MERGVWSGRLCREDEQFAGVSSKMDKGYPAIARVWLAGAIGFEQQSWN